MSRTRNWLRVIRREIDLIKAEMGHSPIKWNLLMKEEEENEIERFSAEPEIPEAENGSN